MKNQDKGYYLPHLNSYILAKLAALPHTFGPKDLNVGPNGRALAKRLASDGLVLAAGSDYKVLEKDVAAAAKKAVAAQLGFADVLRNDCCWHILCALPQRTPHPKLSHLAGIADERLRYTADPLLRNRVIARAGYWRVDWGANATQELKDLVMALREMLADRGPPHPATHCIYQRGLEAAWIAAWPALRTWGVRQGVPGTIPIAFLGGSTPDVVDALFLVALARARIGWKQPVIQSDNAVPFLVRHLASGALPNKSLRNRFSFYGFGSIWQDVAEALADKPARSGGLKPLNSHRFSAWPSWTGPLRFGTFVALPFRRDAAFNRLARSSSR